MASSPKMKTAIGLIAVAALCAAAYLLWKYEHGRQNGLLTLYGNVDIRQVDVGFRVPGRILEVLVDEGDRVEKGQPLAKLDVDLLRQQKEQAQAALDAEKASLLKLERGYRVQEIAQARAAVSEAVASAENAEINLKRVAGLRKSNAISQRELDNTRAAEQEARARLKSARDNLDMLLSGYREEEVLAQKARVEQAEAEFKRASIHLDDGVLFAPQKGIILTRAREAGAIVADGQTVYTITLTDPLWLRAYVSEPDLGKIKPGMDVLVGVDSAPDKKFAGVVGFISPTAEFTPKTVETKDIRTNLVYRIRVRAQDPENVMRQGMPVTIFVDTAGNE